MTIEITRETQFGAEHHNLFRIMDVEAALHLTSEAIRDIADAIETEAKAEAPLGATGELKDHPVDVNEIVRSRHGVSPRRGTPELSFGEVVEPFPSIGGGLTVRGGNPLNRGQFSKGGVHLSPGTRFERPIPGTAGETVEEIVVSVAEEPAHAHWVHDGTGIYGPEHRPITPHPGNKFLVFFFDKEAATGDKFVGKEVKGQKPNPYLVKAFATIERTFIPLKVEELRLEIKVL